MIYVNAAGELFTCGLVDGLDQYRMGDALRERLRDVMRDPCVPHSVDESIHRISSGCDGCPSLIANFFNATLEASSDALIAGLGNAGQSYFVEDAVQETVSSSPAADFTTAWRYSSSENASPSPRQGNQTGQCLPPFKPGQFSPKFRAFAGHVQKLEGVFHRHGAPPKVRFCQAVSATAACACSADNPRAYRASRPASLRSSLKAPSGPTQEDAASMRQAMS